MALQRTRIKDVTLTATDILDDSYLVADADQGASTYLYEKITGNVLKKVIIAMQKDARMLWNVGLSVVANTPTNGLTIALKQADGSTDPATAHKNKCVIAFRSSTLTSGALVYREVTAALSTVITSGSTAGFFAAKAEKLHIFAIDNAGTVELAWSGSDIWDEASLQSTTAEGGAGAADSKTTLYSTTARSNVAIRYLGYALLTEATPGTWVTDPSQIVIGKPSAIAQRHSVICDTGNGHGSTDTKIRRWTNATTVGTAITRASSAGNGDTFTINEDGIYTLNWCDVSSAGAETIGFSVNSTQLTTSITGITASNRTMVTATPSANNGGAISYTGRFVVGDVIRCHDNGGTTSVDANSRFVIIKVG